MYSFEKLEPRILLSAVPLPITTDPPVVEIINGETVLPLVAEQSPTNSPAVSPHQEPFAQTSVTQPGGSEVPTSPTSSTVPQVTDPPSQQSDLTDPTKPAGSEQPDTLQNVVSQPPTQIISDQVEPTAPILSTNSLQEEGAALPPVLVTGVSTNPNEIIFINDDIESSDALIDDLKHQDEKQQVIILDATSNGLTQISNALAGYSSVDTISFISHGADGTVKLGNTWLSTDNIERNAESIATWGKALSGNGDILFYGCDLAANQEGQELLNKIADLTSADVAASTNTTGHEVLGGDWILEYRLGTIEADTPITPQMQNDWVHVLAEEIIADNFNTLSYSNNTGTALWAGSWTEIGEVTDPAAGNLSINANKLSIMTANDEQASRGISRIADLSTAASAFLSFDYEKVKIGNEGNVQLQIRKDSGSSWNTIGSYTITSSSPTQTAFIDISSFSSSTTEIRFFSRGEENGGLSKGVDQFLVDNLQIEYTTTNWTSALWLTTDANVSAGGQQGISTWNKADIVRLADPNLSFDPGTTSGTFSLAAQMSLFADGGNINGLHYVSSDIQLGSSGYQLYKGDVLFTSASQKSAAFGGIDAKKDDIILYHPAASGNYSAGTFTILFKGLVPEKELRDITLIESDVTVGGKDLHAGDLLFLREGGSEEHNIWLYETDDVEPRTGPGDTTGTSGTVSILLNGSDPNIDISQRLTGIDLVERTITIGGSTLNAGTILLSVDASDTIGLTQVEKHDIFALNVTSASNLSDPNIGAATASLFFDGSDVAFNQAPEKIDGFTLTVSEFNNLPTGSVTISGTAAQNQTLTAANTLADADGLGTITYTWQANGSTVGTGTTYALTEAEVGKNITVVASFTDGDGTVETVTSAATAAVANVNDTPTGSVTIGGTATQGQTMTAANTLADADGLGTITYTWQANGSTVGSGTTYVLTEAEVGKNITVVASYTDGHGTAEAVASAATAAVVNVNDAPSGSVTISGTTTQGQTMTAANTLADADGLGTITYTWQANGSTVGSGTSYVLTEGEVGKIITVIASYTDGHGTAEAVASAATAAVVNANDAPSGSVTISGTTTQGQTLTAANTLADADGLGTITYTWRANGSTVGNGATFVLTEAEVGKNITVVASYTDGHGTAEAVASAATAAVVNVNDAPTGSVTISGTPTQGQTLTAANSLADADGLGTITYAWQANGSTIGTGNSYTLTVAEVGMTITVEASYTDSHGTPEAVISGATEVVTSVNTPPTGSVTISGTPTQGQTLTAANTLADPDGLGTITYLWHANGSSVGSGTTYALTEAEVGKNITVIASYIDGNSTAEAVASAATASVANVNDVPTGSVTISGAATQGQTLVAANTLADADGLGTITYTWQANGSTVGSGTTFVLTETEVGKNITVVASYSDGHGTAEAVASATTAAVANVNDTPTGSVTISGAATQGQTLNAANTLADADGLGTITYTWQANGSTVGSGTTYVLTEAEVGKNITILAIYTDGHGTAEAVASAATAAVVNVNDAPTGSVTISGTATQGQTLTAANTLADADDLGTITYTWQANGSTVGSGTTFALTETEVGKNITVVASYTDGHGTAEAVASATTAVVVNVNDIPTGSVTISGTATQNQTLTAANTLADADGLGAITYTWQANGSTVGSGTSYALTEAEVGKNITVVASYSDGHGTAEAAASAATAAVVNVNDTPTGSVTISGTPTQGQTLTAINTLADADGLGTITYTWKADGNVLGSGATYVLTEAEVGMDITVLANYNDGHGISEAVASAATAAVANVNDAPTGSVTISGTPTPGQTLTAANTLADADGLGAITYTWQADGSTVGTGATYVLTEVELGKNITVVASYIDGHGISETMISSPTSPVTIPTPPTTVLLPPDNTDPEPTTGPETTTGPEPVIATINTSSEPAIPAADPFTAVISLATGYPAAEATPPPSLPPQANEDSAPASEEPSEEKIEATLPLDAADLSRHMQERSLITENTSQPAPITIDFSFRNFATTFSPATNLGNKFALSASFLENKQTAILSSDNFHLLDLEYRQRSASEYDALKNSLDTFREDAEKETVFVRRVVGSAIAASTGLSAGYVIWLLRSGILLSSLLSSLPAWQLADPLAILVGRRGKEDKEDEDDSIESIIAGKTEVPSEEDAQKRV